uniref:Transglutaminase N-terminal domain-containing protein n=1 Tax=Anolis carolinensis TaxID=28377 RepID=A0A803TFM3_ANOCA
HPDSRKESNPSRVVGIDICKDENASLHRTNKFKDKNLAVRRGQEFKLKITLSRELKANEEITLKLSIGKQACIKISLGIQVQLVLNVESENTKGLKKNILYKGKKMHVLFFRMV